MNKILLSVFVSIVLCGCSSIVSESNYPVSVNSFPQGATYTVYNEDGQIVQRGETPSTIVLDAGAGFFDGETYTFKIKKEGFFDETYTLNSTIDGWYFGNLLFGGIPGFLIVDPLTGAMFSLPERVNVELSEAKLSSNSLKIISIDELDTTQRSKLIKL